MIEAKVVFDGHYILVNGHKIFENVLFEDCECFIEIDGIRMDDIKNIEQAIAYCLEHSNDNTKHRT